MAIEVRVSKWGQRPHYYMRWTDPATGKRQAKSTGETRKRAAERVAARWERELRSRAPNGPDDTTWEAFTWAYQDEVLPGKAKKTGSMVETVLNAVERIIGPALLADVNEDTLGRLVAQLREEKRTEATIGGYLAHLHAAMVWAKRRRMLGEVPCFPKVRAKKRGRRKGKGRPVSPEEFHRMLLAVPRVVGEEAAESWRFLLRGLWWGGLRLSEALDLRWDDREHVCAVMDRGRPMFWIPGDRQKSGEDETTPMAPEFAELLDSAPVDQRTGRVFRLVGVQGRPLADSMQYVSAVIVKIGREAGVEVSRHPKTGKMKHASAHDLRRSFGSRWAPRLKPAALMKLMRHADISTTMDFYVDLDADDLAAEIWAVYENGNRLATPGEPESTQARCHARTCGNGRKPK